MDGNLILPKMNTDALKDLNSIYINLNDLVF